MKGDRRTVKWVRRKVETEEEVNTEGGWGRGTR
jgi:hypothetical protein